MSEAVMTINGVNLTPGQSMTMRVALEAFASDLKDPDALGDDEIGRTIRTAYVENIHAIRNLYMRNQK